MDAPEPDWLLHDERLLWQGKPPRGLRFTPHDWELVPFTWAWAGFAAFWNRSVWHVPRDWLMRVWGAPFLATGAYLLVGRFAVDAWIRRRQHYYITDRRAVITRGGWRGGLISVGLDGDPVLAMTERRDGSGDLRLGPLLYKRGRSGQLHERGRLVPALSPTPQFLSIPEVATVLNLAKGRPPWPLAEHRYQ